MGNMYSTKRNDVLRKNKNVNTQSRRKFLPVTSEAGDNSGNSQVVTLPEFTDKQKELVIESWTILKKDIDQVGLALFMKLFASNPDVQGVFSPFKGLSQEELSQSNQLRSHAMRVTGTVDKCLSCFEDRDKVLETLLDLGSRHVMYNAKVDYMDLIGPQFILAIQPVLGSYWSSELENAWSDLFKLIAHIMKTAMTF